MKEPSVIEARLEGRLGRFRLDAAFEVPAAGVTALFGPSGSGKTTLLRCIAGLERLQGRVAVRGEVWQDQDRFLPPHRRPGPRRWRPAGSGRAGPRAAPR